MKRLWRRRNLIIGVVLLSNMIFFLYVSLFPLVYRSTAVVSFRPNAYEVDGPEDIASDSKNLPDIMEAEIGTIHSDTVLDVIINTLDLSTKPEYNPTLKKEKILNRFFDSEYRSMSIDSAVRLRLKRNIETSPILYSEIHISALSVSPRFSADLSNAAAKIYQDMESVNGHKEVMQKAGIPKHAEWKQFIHPFLILNTIAFITGIFLASLKKFRATKIDKNA